MKIIVACSGGPDSMALLDQLRKKDYAICVAHVNYHQRPTANRDERIVKEYCDQYHLEFRSIAPQWIHRGNFQAWARHVRYDFFFSCAKEIGTTDIYVAHQLDDVLETYIFQKQNHRIPQVYGLASISYQHGFRIIRPLLQCTKMELRQYCDDNSIPYGIDESNLTDHYTRNVIRHHVLDGYTKEQKQALLQEINEQNEKLQKKRLWAQKQLSSLHWLDDPEAWFILDVYLYEQTHKHFAKKFLMDMVKQLHGPCVIDLGAYELERWQDQLYCMKKEMIQPMHLNQIEYGDFQGFSLRTSGTKIESVNIKPSDFPITIRLVQPGDQIHMRFGTKKVSRFFVDRKIPHLIRKRWLVIENCHNQVIFVPKIGCDINHYSAKPNVFMVQYTLLKENAK